MLFVINLRASPLSFIIEEVFVANSDAIGQIQRKISIRKDEMNLDEEPNTMRKKM